MRHSALGVFALFVASLVLVASVSAQAKKDPETGLYRIEGTVESIEKDKTCIMVKEASSANVVWEAVYTDETAFTANNKDSSLDAVENGHHVIVLGEFEDPEKHKTRMTATRVDIRRK
jgi:hypothetical protein